MTPLAIITFREFFEAWLIVGLFIGIAKSLNLGRGRDMLKAVLLGMVIAIIIPSVVFLAGDSLQRIWTEEKVELTEGVLMIVASLMIGIVSLYLHKFFSVKRQAVIKQATEKLQTNVFDRALFTIIVISIVREGLEIGLFALSISLVTPVKTLFLGLGVGFALASVVGIFAMLAYKRLPIKKIYAVTEIGILFVGAALFKNGISEILEVIWHIDTSKILPLPLSFMPSHESLLGHFLNTIFGIEREFSLAKLLLITLYFGAVYYFVFHRAKQKKIASATA